MILDQLLKHGIWKLLLVTCTIVGAFGGFPTPPKIFSNLATYQIVQWGLVFVLAYQGGAGEDPLLAAAATAATFVLYKVIKYMEGDDDEDLLL